MTLVAELVPQLLSYLSSSLSEKLSLVPTRAHYFCQSSLSPPSRFHTCTHLSLSIHLVLFVSPTRLISSHLTSPNPLLLF